MLGQNLIKKNQEIAQQHLGNFWKPVRENPKVCGLIEVGSFIIKHFWIFLNQMKI